MAKYLICFKSKIDKLFYMFHYVSDSNFLIKYIITLQKNKKKEEKRQKKKKKSNLMKNDDGEVLYK